ncbi:unnamed protein product [Cuscuta campestris]|uniref:Uncharacterized protein n=1 Tax=Cuscuta campestris TaxID=132261 RepID=A0A484M607_9ASTE|nr:unnamed protein product [Cuscuta campestris]
MELGKLREAIPFYTKVMDGMPFRNELHGRAALQWSICQDSLQRPDEARTMYEKLQSHPSVQVRKKARNFVYSFEIYMDPRLSTDDDEEQEGPIASSSLAQLSLSSSRDALKPTLLKEKFEVRVQSIGASVQGDPEVSTCAQLEIPVNNTL